MNAFKLFENFFSNLTGNYVSEISYMTSMIRTLSVKTPEQFGRLVRPISYSLKDEKIFQDVVYTYARRKGDCEDFARIYNVASHIMKLPAYFCILYDDEVGHAFALSYNSQYVYVFEIGFILRFKRSALTYENPEIMFHEVISKYIQLFEAGAFNYTWSPSNIIYTRLNEKLMPIDSESFYKNPMPCYVTKDQYDRINFIGTYNDFFATISFSALLLRLLSGR